MQICKVISWIVLTVLFTACHRPPTAPGGLLIPILDSLKDIPLAASSGQKVELPPVVDMEPNLPPAGDQGKQGSCVSWALGYNLISYYEKSANQLPDYGIVNGTADPRRVYSPAFIYNYLKQNVYPAECLTGVFYRDAFNVIQRMGNCTWADFPYNPVLTGCSGGVSRSSMDSAALHKGYSFERINRKLYDIQLRVALGYPVIVGIFTSKNLYEEGLQVPKDRPFIWNPERNDKDQYHAMLVVGYDKAKFKVMNSWGKSWGKNGYAWISYDKLIERTVETYVCRKTAPERGIAGIEIFKWQNNKAFTKELSTYLPTTALVSFDNFSMKLRMTDTSAQEIQFKFYDSTAPDLKYSAYLRDGEEKQLYVSDSLITIYTAITKSKQTPVELRVTVDSGQIDDNLRDIDSILNLNYAQLQNGEILADKYSDNLLAEFKKWKSNYRNYTMLEEQQKTVSWWFWGSIVTILLLAAAIFFIRRRVRKKS